MRATHKHSPSMEEVRAAQIARWERHSADDAQWLFDHLFSQAERGNRRARRLLAPLGCKLQRLGAVLRQPTWVPIWHPDRLRELGL